MQKAHILKALHEYSDKALKFGINGFITKKSFENKGFEILDKQNSNNLKEFKKNGSNLFHYSFFYLKSTNTLFTEGSDIKINNDVIEIKMRGGNMNVDIENRAVAYNLTNNRKKSLKP